MNNKQLISLLHAMAARIEAEKDYLTQLDNAIGDSDHGINLSRGFRAVDAKLAGLEDALPGDIMKAAGMTLVSTVGGASGPLYGTGFLRIAQTWGDKKEIDIGDFLMGMDAAMEGISQRGHAVTGEKTMLDAMGPALNAMLGQRKKGSEALYVLTAGADAAWGGVEFTKTIVATKGRASYIGERSLGHADPGAVSFTYLLEVCAGECEAWSHS